MLQQWGLCYNSWGGGGGGVAIVSYVTTVGVVLQ